MSGKRPFRGFYKTRTTESASDSASSALEHHCPGERVGCRRRTRTTGGGSRRSRQPAIAGTAALDGIAERRLLRLGKALTTNYCQDSVDLRRVVYVGDRPVVFLEASRGPIPTLLGAGPATLRSSGEGKRTAKADPAGLASSTGSSLLRVNVRGDNRHLIPHPGGKKAHPPPVLKERTGPRHRSFLRTALEQERFPRISRNRLGPSSSSGEPELLGQ